jgi:hypothetical protein
MIRLIERQNVLQEMVKLGKAEAAAKRAEKAKKIGSKTKKRDDNTLDWIGDAA